MRFPDLLACMGPPRVPGEKAPSIPRDLKFNSQRKLDLPLVICQLSCDLACTRAYRFRERCNVTWNTIEYRGAQVIAAEVGMVQDIEEFCAEFHHAGFSQKSELGVLDQ